MYLVILAVLLVGLKLLDVAPIAEWSWWWILSPLVIAFIWFEFLEKLFGFHKHHDAEPTHEKRQRDRVSATFGLDPNRKKRK